MENQGRVASKRWDQILLWISCNHSPFMSVGTYLKLGSKWYSSRSMKTNKHTTGNSVVAIRYCSKLHIYVFCMCICMHSQMYLNYLWRKKQSNVKLKNSFLLSNTHNLKLLHYICLRSTLCNRFKRPIKFLAPSKRQYCFLLLCCLLMNYIPIYAAEMSSPAAQSHVPVVPMYQWHMLRSPVVSICY